MTILQEPNLHERRLLKAVTNDSRILKGYLMETFIDAGSRFYLKRMRLQLRVGNKIPLVTGGVLLGGLMFLGGTPSTAFAQVEDEKKVLEMFYEDKDLVVTPSREPKHISQVAENISIVTAKEIEAIGAHTLADVLIHVPGVQIDLRGGPGVPVNTFIQGSDGRHVLILIDGVTFNTLSDNIADAALIPVQQIERVEIIKGPASSAWGSSLGGVINVISKDPEESRPIKGMLSASIGTRATGDFRGEVTGSKDPFSYYLYAGGLTSDGLRSNTSVDQGNGYTKLGWQLSDSSKLVFTTQYINANRGVGEGFMPSLRTKSNSSFLASIFSLSSALSDNLDLEFSVRGVKRKDTFTDSVPETGFELGKIRFKEQDLGASAKLTWRWNINQVVVGVDYDNGKLESDFVLGGEQRQERYALYANDTVALGPVAIIPGVRFDHTGTNGDFVSPSLGVTWSLDESSFLRFYVARGFSTPPLTYTFATGGLSNSDLKMEKVLSYQAGFETRALRYIWLKGTIFLNDISDVLDLDQNSGLFVNRGKQRRQGVDGEIRTVPFFYTSLLAGGTYVDAEDRSTGDTIPRIARYTYNFGIDFNNPDWFIATLRGRYIWWNAPAQQGGKYTSVAWDMHVAKRILTRDNLEIDLFLTGHNLFRGSQYADGAYKNADQWFEGGVRFRF
ncbi:MAG: TonB-dependent receptor [Desulfuromonadales bacterium]|nr:MAG: TonB-dependent receptor [Desulfuromonadales bacterium]